MFKAAETQARIVLGVVKWTANGPNTQCSCKINMVAGLKQWSG